MFDDVTVTNDGAHVTVMIVDSAHARCELRERAEGKNTCENSVRNHTQKKEYRNGTVNLDEESPV